MPDTQPESQTTSTPSPGADAATILEGADAAVEAATDWRVTLAGDDKGALKDLERFKSSGDYRKAFNDAQELIRSGKHKEAPSLADDASDEDVAAYREQIGVPAEAKGYLDDLPNGMVLGETDEASFLDFAEHMHKGNTPPGVVHQAIEWYQNFGEAQAAERKVADKAQEAETIEMLRAEWGGDYKPNLDSALNFLNSTAPTMDDGTSVADLILGGRTSDGQLLGNHPGFLRWMTAMAHEQNPAGFIAPSTGLTQNQSVDAEIKEIEDMMRSDRSKYNADEAKQARLRDLYEARTRLSKAA